MSKDMDWDCVKCSADTYVAGGGYVEGGSHGSGLYCSDCYRPTQPQQDPTKMLELFRKVNSATSTPRPNTLYPSVPKSNTSTETSKNKSGK